jgi:hypothetical protein
MRSRGTITVQARDQDLRASTYSEPLARARVPGQPSVQLSHTPFDARSLSRTRTINHAYSPSSWSARCGS